MYGSIRLGRQLGYSFRWRRALGLFLLGAWFSSWNVASIHSGQRAQSPQSGPRWSPAFKAEPVLFPPSALPCTQLAFFPEAGVPAITHVLQVQPSAQSSYQQIFQAKLYVFTEVVPCPGFGGEVQVQLLHSLLWEHGHVPLDGFLDCTSQITICCCSAAQVCCTLCDPMDWIMPGFPVHPHLPKFAQIHIPWVCDAV